MYCLNCTLSLWRWSVEILSYCAYSYCAYSDIFEIKNCELNWYFIPLCVDGCSGEEVSVESLWVLALALKVFHNLLKSDSIFNSPDIFRADFIQSLVFIASKGTGFSQQWLLKDLEVSVCCLSGVDGYKGTGFSQQWLLKGLEVSVCWLSGVDGY